jgi:hypothetical protein
VKKPNHNDVARLFPAEVEFPTILPAPPPRIAPLKPTVVYDTYWRFAAERQRIFFRRLQKMSPPWTDDPVLRTQ